MNWNVYTKGFKSFLALEKSLSENSIEAYLHDVDKLIQFLEFAKYDVSPKDIELKHLQELLMDSICASMQISGIITISTESLN